MNTNYGASLKKQPAFGMKIKMNNDAIKIIAEQLTVKKIIDLRTETKGIKTEHGKEIFISLLGNLKNNSLKLVGSSEGKKTKTIRLSCKAGNTELRNGEGLIATLKDIKKVLDSKILKAEVAKNTSDINLLKAGPLNEKESLLKAFFG